LCRQGSASVGLDDFGTGSASVGPTYSLISAASTAPYGSQTGTLEEELPESVEFYENLESCPPEVDPAEFAVKVAAGKASGILEHMGTTAITIEKSSVYGAALVLPQLARTSEWALSFATLSIRTYILLIANIWLQGFLLYMISMEERIMDKYGAQMRLCDFGAHIDNCPDAPNCVGPGGTVFTSDRLYDWSIWSSRRFVKESFLQLFPDRIDEINKLIDPGEYGVESYNLRIVSVYLFVLGLWADLASSLEMALLLWEVPSEPEFWMRYAAPDPMEKAATEFDTSTSELTNLRFLIAGMPLKWKVVNLLLVWCPKVYLWLLTVDIGVVFLMETSKIEDMIINSVALAFILGIDEVIFASLMPSMSIYMMDRLEDFSSEDAEENTYWAKDAVQRHEEDLQWTVTTIGLYLRIIPLRLVLIALICVVFMTKYYMESCRRRPDGSLTAKDVSFPVNDDLPFWSFLLGPIPGMTSVEVEDTPVWQMSYAR
jgi:hypothetical protein